MIINSINIRNYRPFGEPNEVKLGSFSTLVGQNDVGKSNILKALRLFFQEKPKVSHDDVYDRALPDDNIIIEVSFNPRETNIELESVVSTLKEEMLLDDTGLLRIRKVFPREKLAMPKVNLITFDYDVSEYKGLTKLKEKDLNERCVKLEIDVKKSGRGITNYSKRVKIRKLAENNSIGRSLQSLSLSSKDDLWKAILSILPQYSIFEADTKLGIGETTFQNQFNEILTASLKDEDIQSIRETFEKKIEDTLQCETDRIFNYFKKYTQDYIGLTAKPMFDWKKSISFELLARDQQGIETSFERRGSGMRRLLMVAFFQYLAERGMNNNGKFIYAVEEPENFIHPRLQRELINSFNELAKKGYQILISTHSPVFAGSTPIEDLTLVARRDGKSEAIQFPELKLDHIAEELGVEPSDQITNFHAIIFVEGYKDEHFFCTVASKLKSKNHIQYDFNDKKIGFIICGGDNIKHWISRRSLKRINKRYGVVIDSDKKIDTDNLPQRKLNWKNNIEEDGGFFHILRKRTIENYLHPNALKRCNKLEHDYNEFSNMKQIFGDNVYSVIDDMSAEEILEMDCFKENGKDHNELKELIWKLLLLPDQA